MITKIKFEALLDMKRDPCISIYIPTYRSGHNQEDKLRFKNALKEAKNQLVEFDYEEKEAHQFLTKAYTLLDDEEFWLKLSDGLAVFITDSYFEYFVIPTDVNPFVSVANEFYLRPLLPVLTGRQRFFLLALSQNEIRFFEGNKYSIVPVIIEDLVPENIEEALSLDVSVTDLQSHSGNPSAGTPIFHGNNLGKDHKLKQLRQYFRLVDNGLMKMLHDENEPLVLSGVDYLIPIYKEVSDYKYIVETHIGGNPENYDPVLLHEKAWFIINQFNKDYHNELKENYLQKAAKQQVEYEISSIIRALDTGKVETLFVNKDKKVWGDFDFSSRSLNVHLERKATSKDLLELASKLAYQKGGEVFNVGEKEMPAPKFEANAILRY